jgi:CDP-diacylglycerol--glycerol-3-phosphate 3-phosphatidyltransferase
MPSVYDLKPAFQKLLRPLVRGLVGVGATPNQVTVAALFLSAAAGVAIGLRPESPWPLLALPVILFLRMALNAIDGMMAREHDMATPLGAILNEAGDVASDTVLYLPLALAPNFNPWLVLIVVFLAGLTELVGITSAAIGASRRYDGPMGKSDRAFWLSILAVVGALWPGSGPTITGVLVVIVALEIVTIANRARAAVREIEE